MQGISRSLHTLWTIFKHEFGLYWISPIAYLVGAAWLFLGGFFFSRALGAFNGGGFGFGGGIEPSMSYTLAPMAFLLMFLAPALTMRLVADEIRSGTHELLLTSPVRDWEVIVGKWLCVWGVFSVFIVITLLYPFILAWRGSPDQGTMITGYLGFWLWAGAVLAIGVLASALTQYQLIAFMIGEGIALVLFLADGASSLITQPTIGTILSEITLTSHFHRTMLERGLIDPVDLAYFIGLMALSLFLATQTLSMRRWRA